MKKTIIKWLISLGSNNFFQSILEKFYKLVIILLGFGSGSFPSESGEGRVFSELVKIYPKKKEPLIIFDVGANKGQYLQLVLEHLQKFDFRVFSFEPAKAPFEDLHQRFHEDHRVKLENLGLDNSDHRSKLYYEAPNSLRASKYQRDLRHLGVEFSISEEVDFVTLDHYCESHQINHIDLLKIDVEGNEFNVLLGAEQMLAQKAIGLITFEFGRANVDSRIFFKDIFYFLKNYKMQSLYRIFPNGYLKLIENYDERHETFFPTNYLAIM